MILIKKRQGDALPQAYQDWLAENQTEIERLSADLRSPKALWELLGKPLTVRETQIDPLLVRYDLQCSLYEEQGGICCYCGDRLRRDWDEDKQKWRFVYQSIEHFKGKSQHKDLIFDYKNLMLCCKNSTSFSRFRVGDTYGTISVKGWEDVAHISGIPAEKIRDYRSNQHLKRKMSLENGDLIHIPNPTHCDDEKSKFDSAPGLEIINPVSDEGLIGKLVHSSDGSIGVSEATEQEETIAQKTIQVLALEIDKLKEKRRVVWGGANRAFEEKYADSFELINGIESNERRREIVSALIEEILTPDDSDGLLSPFCFVEYASLKAQFGAQSLKFE